MTLSPKPIYGLGEYTLASDRARPAEGLGFASTAGPGTPGGREFASEGDLLVVGTQPNRPAVPGSYFPDGSAKRLMKSDRVNCDRSRNSPASKYEPEQSLQVS